MFVESQRLYMIGKILRLAIQWDILTVTDYKVSVIRTGYNFQSPSQHSVRGYGSLVELPVTQSNSKAVIVEYPCPGLVNTYGQPLGRVFRP